MMDVAILTFFLMFEMTECIGLSTSEENIWFVVTTTFHLQSQVL